MREAVRAFQFVSVTCAYMLKEELGATDLTPQKFKREE